jgi:hypothetical protein
MWYSLTGPKGLRIWDGSDPAPSNHAWQWVDRMQTTFYENAGNGVYHIPTPILGGAGNWIEIRYYVEVNSESKQAHPSFTIEGWNPITFLKAQWVGDVMHGGSLTTTSAGITWIQPRNVSGTTLRMGYIDGGNWWYLKNNGFYTGTLTLRRLSSTKTAVVNDHIFERRDADYPANFRFFGIVQQPMSAITGIDYGAMGQEIRASHRLQYS